MTRSFGTLPGGETAHLYTICGGGLTAGISDFGATLVSLLAPDREGHLADVVLGFDTAGEYLHGSVLRWAGTPTGWAAPACRWGTEGYA